MSEMGDEFRAMREHKTKQKDRNYERRYAELRAATATMGLRFHLREQQTVARCWFPGSDSLIDWWMRTGSARFVGGPHTVAGTLQADTVGRISKLLREGP